MMMMMMEVQAVDGVKHKGYLRQYKNKTICSICAFLVALLSSESSAMTRLTVTRHAKATIAWLTGMFL